jgi:hypothetical protein
MPAFTISAAARLCGVDRRTLQRAIHAGRLHLDAQHCLSREGLIAAGYFVASTPQEEPQSTPQSTPQMAPLLALLEHHATAIADLHQEVRHLREDPRHVSHDTPHEAPHQRRRKAVTMPHGTPHERSQSSDAPQATPRGAPHYTPHVTPQITPHHTAAPYRLRSGRGVRPHARSPGPGALSGADRRPTHRGGHPHAPWATVAQGHRGVSPEDAREVIA